MAHRCFVGAGPPAPSPPSAKLPPKVPTTSRGPALAHSTLTLRGESGRKRKLAVVPHAPRIPPRPLSFAPNHHNRSLAVALEDSGVVMGAKPGSVGARLAKAQPASGPRLLRASW